METNNRPEWKDLPNDILNVKCTDQHLFRVAEMMESWEHIAYMLGLTEAKIVEIQKDHKGNYLQQKYKSLIEWRCKYGSEATYRALLQCFDECEKREYVEKLTDMIRKGEVLFTSYMQCRL